MSSFFHFSKVHQQYFKKYGQLVSYKRGQYLVWAADENPCVFHLSSGSVRVAFGFNDGDDRILGFFVPGMTFAQSGSFFNDDGGRLEYIAHDEVKAYRISREDFLRQVSSDQEFANDYVNALSRNQVFLIERIIYQAERGIKRKYLRWLLFMAKYYGRKNGQTCFITIPLTQSAIANFLNATRESVNTITNALIDEGFISIEKKHIIIHSSQKIHKVLDT